MEQMYLIHRLFINAFAYAGLVLGVDQEMLSGALMRTIQLSPSVSNLVVFMGVVMWVIKLVWFVYDKFILERAERKKKLNE